MTYLEKLSASIRSSQSVLCAGIDPVPEHFPHEIKGVSESESEQVVTFCRKLIEQTKSGVAAYKINVAYFEALGRDAYCVLDDVLDAVPAGKILIADAKRGDVPHTNQRYKTAFFDKFGFDAITLSPFMGTDTMEPFLQDASKAVYALTLTSNPGAHQLMTRPFGDEPSLSLYLAKLLADFNKTVPGTTGMVIGATQHKQYGPVMKANPAAPLLIPGVGAQGGSIEELAVALSSHNGLPLINVSRGLSLLDPDKNAPWDMQVSFNTSTMKSSFSSIADACIEKSSTTR